ncbi:MAG: hypothetical protein HY698_14970 [Deltaproteobacteria bacterium]|nr:hypothetical protein [Deltaproteobacteria bacterium]
MSRALFFVAMAAWSCATSTRHDQDLLGEVRGYVEGIRWRRYEDSAVRIPPKEREPFLDERELVDEDLRIDDYEIARVKLGRGGRSAVVQVKYTWHLDSAGVVHESTVEQSWKREELGWFLMTEHLKRGEPMPGVEEKDGDEAGEGKGE